MARRPRRSPPSYPAAVERSYADQCEAAVTAAWGSSSARIARAFARLEAQRADADDKTHRTLPGVLSEVLAGIEMEFGRRMSRRAPLLPMRPGRSAADYGRQATEEYLGAVVAVRPLEAEPWLQPALDAWTASNVELIQNLAPRHMRDVEDLVTQAWTSGRRAEWLSRELEGRLGISERRARLIARDQIGKLNGALQMIRQSSYGVRGYIWRSSLDERVRQVHAERDGERFDWGTPPPDGHPGMPVQCRCVPEPDIDDQLAELEALGESEWVPGPPDAELLEQAVRDLGEWAPDPSQVEEWVQTAVAGVSALQDPVAMRGEERRAPQPRTVRDPRKPRVTRRATR